MVRVAKNSMAYRLARTASYRDAPRRCRIGAALRALRISRRRDGMFSRLRSHLRHAVIRACTLFACTALAFLCVNAQT